MKNILLLVSKDFKRKWKNPFVILGFLLMPLLFTLILGVVFGDSNEPSLPKVRVLAADNDQTLLSKLFLGAFSQGELKELIDLEIVDEEEGKKQLNKGKASALLVVPKDFQEDVFNDESTEILLEKNPSQQFLPQIVEEIGDIYTFLISALFSLFSEEVKLIRNFSGQDTIPDQAISLLSVKIKGRLEGVSKYVFPPVISIKQTTADKEGKEEEEDEFSFQQYVLPGISIMFLLFICNIVFEDLLRENEGGTLLRMMVSPLRISEFIWSKIVTAVILGVLCTVFLVFLGVIIFKIKWGHPLLLLVFVLCLNILIAGFIAFLYSFVRTERQAGALLSTVILVMSLLGGSMLPAQFFPSAVQLFSKLTINYWGIEGFYRIMHSEPLRRIVPFLIGMGGGGVVFAFIGSYFLNSRLKRGLLK